MDGAIRHREQEEVSMVFWWSDDPAEDAERWYNEQSRREDPDDWDDLGEERAWERFCENEK